MLTFPGGAQFLTGSDIFNSLGNALERSCYRQMDTCQNAANKGGNKGDLTVGGCSTQVSSKLSEIQDPMALTFELTLLQMQACLKVAQAA